MSNDPAMALAVSAGSKPSSIFLSTGTVLGDLVRIQRVLNNPGRSVRDIIWATKEIDQIKGKLQIASDAFQIWKGLHPDLVKKYEESAEETTFDYLMMLEWSNVIGFCEKNQEIIEKMTQLEILILELRA